MHLIEERVFQGFGCRYPLLRVEHKHFCNQVHCVCSGQMLVEVINERWKFLFLEFVVVKFFRHLEAVLQVKFQQLVWSKNLDCFYELLEQIFTQNKWVFLENNWGENHTCRPNVYWVMIIGVFKNQLRGLKESAIYLMTLLTLRFVEKSLTKVNKLHFLGIKFVENILRL